MNFIFVSFLEDLQDMKACKCLNGGTCDEYQMCKCPEQFTGTVCEIEKQNSCTKDCQHGGICLNNKCICVQGYTGDDCSSGEFTISFST